MQKHIQSLRRSLSQMFWPTRAMLVDDQVQRRPGGRFGPLQLVIARRHCRHYCFDLSGLQRRDRNDRLSLLLDKESPWPRAGRFVTWQGHHAQAWIWPSDPIERALQALDLAPDADITCLPESALFAPPPSASSQRVLKLAEGCEGQVWRNGILQDSRWWPAEPSAAQWHALLRAQSLVPAPPPYPVTETWQFQAFGKPDRSALNLERLPLVPVLQAGTVVLTIWLGAVAASWVEINGQLHQLQERNDTLTERAEAELAARETAINMRPLLQTQVDVLQQQGDIIALLAHLRELLPETADLEELEWRDSEIRLRVRDEEADPRVYVQRLEAHKRFTNAFAEPGRESNLLQVTARVRDGADS